MADKNALADAPNALEAMAINFRRLARRGAWRRK
jgi:hypothetical protein